MSAARMQRQTCSPGRESRQQVWSGRHTCLWSSAAPVEVAATMEVHQHQSRAELPGKTTTSCTCHNAAARRVLAGMLTGEMPQGVWRAAACIGACASVVRGTGGAVGRGSGRTILSHGAGVLRVACGPMAPAAHLCTRLMSRLHPTPSRLPYSAAARRRAAATRSEPSIVVAVS